MPNDDITSGFRTGVALAVAAGDEGPERAARFQPSLFPADRTDELPAGAIQRAEALKVRGPGRPAGAINKSTAGWRDYILARYPSPLLGLAETYARSVHDLAVELRCTPLEAAKLQHLARVELAPYLHGKMPVEIDIKGGLPVLQLVALGDMAQLANGGLGLPDLAGLKIIENQALAGEAEGRVGQQELDSSPQSQEIRASRDVEQLIDDQPDGDR